MKVDRDQISTIAHFEALRRNIPYSLVMSIISVESAFDTYAVRYEPKWSWFSRPGYWSFKDAITDETERVLQKMSFGLMQIMGAVARELGHDGSLLELVNPQVNIALGTLKLSQLLEKYSLHSAIAAYNAGSPRLLPSGEYTNQKYIDAVLTVMAGYNDGCNTNKPA